MEPSTGKQAWGPLSEGRPLPNPAHRDCLGPVKDRYRAAEEGTFPRHALVGTAFERRFISAQEDQPTFHTALGKTEL